MKTTLVSPRVPGRLRHENGRRSFVRHALGCVVTAPCLLFRADLPYLGDIDAVAAQGGERRYPLPSADGVVIDKDAAAGLARYQGKVFALSLACPHQRAAVRWLATEQRFQCSKHDSKYQPTGTYTSGRATRNLDRFPIRRDGDILVVDVTRVFKSDQDAAAWNNAAIQI